MRPLRDLGFLVLVSASVAVAGCGSGAGGPGSGPVRSGAGSKSAGRIGAVLPTFSHPFFLAQKRGLEEKAKELGVEIDVRDGQDDDVKQTSQVETLINLGCEALILCPRDEDALVPAVEAANPLVRCPLSVEESWRSRPISSTRNLGTRGAAAERGPL